MPQISENTLLISELVWVSYSELSQLMQSLSKDHSKCTEVQILSTVLHLKGFLCNFTAGKSTPDDTVK
jgi:hypothetical protein